jgi:RNA polymerase sigma factor (sigma-70 family)
MRDSEVAASIEARDPAGLAEAYDKYAARIFSFCRSLLGDPADAVDAVRDTFLIAASAVSELHDPSRLRPWLYAVARSQCHRRLGAGDLPAAGAEMGGHRRAGDDDHTQLLDLVRTAIGGLDPGDQELIELSLRHRLHGPDLADTLGVPRQDVHALASRAHGRLRESLGALLVAQAGQLTCAALDELLGDENGTTPLPRGLVSRHIEDCQVCAERQRQLLGPVMRLGFVSLAPIPPGLRSRVLRLASDPSPAAAAQRAAAGQQAGAFGAYGFPAAQEAVAGTGRRWRLAPWPVGAIAGTAATAVVASVAAVLVLGLPHTSHQAHSALPAQLSRPIGPAASGGSGARPTATAGNTGTTRTPAPGTYGPAAARAGDSTRRYGGADGALAVQNKGLYAMSTPGSTGSAGTGPGRASTRPASHAASPGNDAGSTAPAKSATPTTKPTPTTSSTPTTSPAPTTSPTPSVTPSTGSSDAPTAGATISVSVGQLVSIGVQLGN